MSETVEQALERELAELEATKRDQALLNSFELGCLRQRVTGFVEAAQGLLANLPDDLPDDLPSPDDFIAAVARLRSLVNFHAKHPSAEIAQQALTEMRARAHGQSGEP